MRNKYPPRPTDEPQTDWLDEFGQEEKIEIVHVRSGKDDWLAAFDAEAEEPKLLAARSLSPRALETLPDETARPVGLRRFVESPLVVAAALFWVFVVATVVALLRPAAFEVAPATNYSAAATTPEPRRPESVPFLEEILGFRTVFGSTSFGMTTARTDFSTRRTLPTARGVITAGALARAGSPLRNRTTPATFITTVVEPPTPLVTLDQATIPVVTQPLPLITLPPEPVAMRAANVSIELPPSVAAPPAPAPAPDPGLKDRTAIQSVLGRYRQAFDTLDASGVETFWPSVNARSLARAFDQLEEQSFRFDTCDIDVSGDRAAAACAGSASYVPKVGGKNTREESRLWTFRLQRGSAGWIIDRVESRVGNAPR